MMVEIHMSYLIKRSPGSAGGKSRLDENLGAVTIEFTSNDLRAIVAAATQIKIEGARSPDKLEALTGR